MDNRKELLEEEYIMNMEDEDEEEAINFFGDDEPEPEDNFAYAMGDDEDEEDYDGDDNGEGFQTEPTYFDTLDALVVEIANYTEEADITLTELRQNLFEERLRPLANQAGVEYEELILSSTQEDQGYNTLLTALYPALAPHISKVLNGANKQLLIDLLNQALTDISQRPNQIKRQPEEDEDNHFDTYYDDEPDPEIEANTMRVMNVYKDLYEVGFELQIPYGILTRDGRLRLRKGKTFERASPSLSRIYSLINDITGNFLVQSGVEDSRSADGLRAINMRKGTSYYPEFQLGNLFGQLGDKKVDSWQELSQSIQPEIRANIKANLEAGRDISQIVDALTTSIVISEFNPKTAISLRISVGNSLINKNNFLREYNLRKSTIMAGVGELFHCEMTKSGVLEVIIVFNKAAYNGRPLFAYEAVQNQLERGRRPNLKNVILGQDTSGKILTANLDTQQASIILVGAGQRSGKGVLTLNLLGTILAEGSPLIYLDGKPDMAPVLWNIGKKYGVNPAAWDLFESNGNIEGMGAPERILMENPGIFGLLMYFKGLQAMMLSASLQAKEMKFLDGKRPFFIFDEAFAVQMQMSSTWQKLVDIAKDKQADPDEKEWATKVVRWGESLNADLPAVINSQLPKSGVSTIWLFQSMQPTSWNPYAVSSLTSAKLNIMKKPIESRLSLKFLGRGTADSEYALGSAKVKENPLVSNRVLSDGGRHFAMTGSQKITDMNSVKVFKPYLVLNESHNGSNSAEELKSNLSTDVLQVVAPNGELHPGAGFEGFAKMIGEDAIQNLSKGREYLEAILSTVGIMENYSSVDEYLYDASLESFKTLGELVRGAEADHDPEDVPYSLYNEDADTESDLGGSTLGSTALGGSALGGSAFSGRPEPSTEAETLDDFDHMPSEEAMEGYPPEAQVNHGYTEPITEPITQSRTRAKEHLEDPYQSPNDQMHYDNVYSEPMKIPYNPYGSKSRALGTLASINATGIMSEFLLAEIKRVFGDFSRIRTLEITSTGLVINDVAFRPQLDPEVIETLPYDIKIQALRGNLTELFNFKGILRFRNLDVLTIDTPRLAEGRVKQEVGLKTWAKYFDKFPSLQRIEIGSTVITGKELAKQYENGDQEGYKLQEKLRDKFKMPKSIISSSHMAKVWDSTPVRVMGGAVGMTLGVKAVSLAASIFGGWGLLFGAFAGYGAYREFKRRN